MCLPLSYSFNLASGYVLISLTYDPFRTVEFRMLLDENIIEIVMLHTPGLLILRFLCNTYWADVLLNLDVFLCRKRCDTVIEIIMIEFFPSIFPIVCAVQIKRNDKVVLSTGRQANSVITF